MAASLRRCRDASGRTRVVPAARVLVLVSIAIIGLVTPVGAQQGDAWEIPENLSRSGVASTPVIVPQPGEGYRVFWWDAIDGLTMAEGVPGEWSEPTATPIYVVEVLDRPLADGTEALFLPVGAMPRILGDPSGNAHAFWIAEPEEDSRATALMYAQLAEGRESWSNARVVAESAAGFDVAIDSDGWLYLAYSRNIHTTNAPAGIVFQRSNSGGDRWSGATTIDRSLYYRATLAEALGIRVAADAGGFVVLTWNDPTTGQGRLAHSEDLGDTWSEVVGLGTDDTPTANARAFVVQQGTQEEPRSAALLLWEGIDGLGGCALYQAPLEDVVETASGDRVLEALNGCPDLAGERLLPLDAEQVALLAGVGTDALALSVWNGEAWSEPVRIARTFESPVTGNPVYLVALTGALSLTDGDEDASAALAVAGVGSDGDVWFTQSLVSAFAVAFAPPSLWSEPGVAAATTALPDLPSLAADTEGRIHALWAEPEAIDSPTKVLRYARWTESGWTRAATVLQAAEGSAQSPWIAATGEHLHAVWSDGPDGQILYSRAFLQDAYAAGGWEEPRALPGPTDADGVGSEPQILVSADGRLHVVYTVPVNEGRGVYTTVSTDGGVTWSEAVQVFDAAGAGWAAVASARLAVDPLGYLHVAWVRAGLTEDAPSLGLTYAFSKDRGATWSEPLLVAEGAHLWPQVEADGLGGVHLFWYQTAGAGGWWHQWSPAMGTLDAERDVPAGWMRAARIPGLSSVAGHLAVVSDGALGLQVVGTGLDSAGEPALLYQTWSSTVQAGPEGEGVLQTDGRWETATSLRLSSAPIGGAAAVLQASSEQLDVLYRGASATAEGDIQPELWHTMRSVTVTDLDPDYRPVASAEIAEGGPPDEDEVASALPTEEPAEGVSRNFAAATPPEEGGMLLPLLVSAGLAAAIVAGVFGSRLYNRWRR